jgi:hypothetical protein
MNEEIFVQNSSEEIRNTSFILLQCIISDLQSFINLRGPYTTIILKRNKTFNVKKKGDCSQNCIMNEIVYMQPHGGMDPSGTIFIDCTPKTSLNLRDGIN